MTDEERRQHADAILADVSLGDWRVLVSEVTQDLEDVYADGMTEGLRLLDVDVPVDHIHGRAVEWAHDRAATLVTRIEENTREMLRATVVDALEERWGARELADAISASTGFSDERARTISRTEISSAHSQGSLSGYRTAAQSGVRVLKEWLDNDSNDESCSGNADDGPIELDEDFSSGADAPPEHPNCVCSLAPYIPDDAEEGDGDDQE